MLPTMKPGREAAWKDAGVDSLAQNQWQAVAHDGVWVTSVWTNSVRETGAMITNLRKVACGEGGIREDMLVRVVVQQSHAELTADNSRRSRTRAAGLCPVMYRVVALLPSYNGRTRDRNNYPYDAILMPTDLPVWPAADAAA